MSSGIILCQGGDWSCEDAHWTASQTQLLCKGIEEKVYMCGPQHL